MLAANATVFFSGRTTKKFKFFRSLINGFRIEGAMIIDFIKTVLLTAFGGALLFFDLYSSIWPVAKLLINP